MSEDTKNGENLLLIRDRRIAVSYVVEALRIFDHYHFRVKQQETKKVRMELGLAKPPRRLKPVWIYLTTLLAFAEPKAAIHASIWGCIGGILREM